MSIHEEPVGRSRDDSGWGPWIVSGRSWSVGRSSDCGARPFSPTLWPPGRGGRTGDKNSPPKRLGWWHTQGERGRSTHLVDVRNVRTYREFSEVYLSDLMTHAGSRVSLAPENTFFSPFRAFESKDRTHDDGTEVGRGGDGLAGQVTGSCAHLRALMLISKVCQPRCTETRDRASLRQR